jgi:hypothetical protein
MRASRAYWALAMPIRFRVLNPRLLDRKSELVMTAIRSSAPTLPEPTWRVKLMVPLRGEFPLYLVSVAI